MTIAPETTKVAIFKGKKVRKTIYNNEWWFSVVDVCGALTESIDSGAFSMIMSLIRHFGYATTRAAFSQVEQSHQTRKAR
ncbi:MAG: hypothetical protein A2782_03545 [Candidatus Blackburnbacteria bacterium RIFCSPHIGHO2_01_FULL_43_15b]|uniref:Bro-N domain-containing protein n=1 Tax=Candidatus Blackburnbacteria bacterium RIFCSPHIGHO2_01_FULL_43_15b TaxID=1797513 RepID=A0A1G1V378_9BACT|nr:MAG: hypothetical protein A2782_03545 [Candidatus Blackburnbacteria bacterium RIFCSPHIGHO2_01_FULL_43_15b]